MTGDIIVPSLGESITEAAVARWLKNQGDYIQPDEPLLELETDKVTLEVNAPVGGYLSEILVAQGAVVAVGSLLGRIHLKPLEAALEPTADLKSPQVQVDTINPPPLSPAVRKMVADHKLDPARIPSSGPDGRLTKGDVLQFLDQPLQPILIESALEVEVEIAVETPIMVQLPAPQPEALADEQTMPDAPPETRVRMSRLRQRIAQRLKEAQSTAAILTTFNEVDMSTILMLRERYQEAFEKKHNVRLGMMSFFVKASVEALKAHPIVNATIEGDDIVYKNAYHIGVAVGTDQGLVVPVIRHAEHLNIPEIERQITLYGQKARQGQLKIEDLTGGTFSLLSNGGIYGSLLSTPILNPPQSAILGMHTIQKRPVVDAHDQIVARPMMYLALSYDHRLIDGKDAVGFLKCIKDKVEQPERMLLDL